MRADSVDAYLGKGSGLIKCSWLSENINEGHANHTLPNRE